VIATLYDVHGNLAALEAVLAEVEPFEEKPGAYWTLDLVHRFTPYEGAPVPEPARAEALAEFTRVGL